MTLLFILFPIIIFPLITSLVWKRYNLKYEGLTFLMTAIFVFINPYIIIWYYSFMYPRFEIFGGGDFVYTVFNVICIIPISMIIQLIYNMLFLKKYKRNKLRS